MKKLTEVYLNNGDVCFQRDGIVYIYISGIKTLVTEDTTQCSFSICWNKDIENVFGIDLEEKIKNIMCGVLKERDE